MERAARIAAEVPITWNGLVRRENGRSKVRIPADAAQYFLVLLFCRQEDAGAEHLLGLAPLGDHIELGEQHRQFGTELPSVDEDRGAASKITDEAARLAGARTVDEHLAQAMAQARFGPDWNGQSIDRVIDDGGQWGRYRGTQEAKVHLLTPHFDCRVSQSPCSSPQA